MTESTNLTASTESREKAFVRDMLELREKDRGRFAELKRNAGKTLAQSKDAKWFFYYLHCHHIHQKEENIFFLVATLIPLSKEKQGDLQGNFGKTVEQLWQKTKNQNDEDDVKHKSSVAKRFHVLLDSDFDEDGGGELAFRLRQMVKLAASHAVGIDWAQLIVDLRQWGQSSKYVQKRWAKSFYDPEQKGQPEKELS